MMNLDSGDLEKIKWVGEQSRSIANHQSGMRLTITALNFAAMGGLLGYASNENVQQYSIAGLLFYSGLIFAVLTLKMSSGHAFAWGVYEKCRNTILPENTKFQAEYKKVKDDYHCKFERNCVWPLCWVTKSNHYAFWPIMNFLIPVFPAILLCYLEWSNN